MQVLICNVSFEWINEKKTLYFELISIKRMLWFSGALNFSFISKIKQLSYVKETPPSNGLILRKLCEQTFTWAKRGNLRKYSENTEPWPQAQTARTNSSSTVFCDCSVTIQRPMPSQSFQTGTIFQEDPAPQFLIPPTYILQKGTKTLTLSVPEGWEGEDKSCFLSHALALKAQGF